MATIELVNIGKTFWARPRLVVGGVDLIEALFGSSKASAEDRREDVRRDLFSIQDLNLTIPDGQVMVLLGPSGCGKTTLLRVIAGLLKPDAGQVLYDGVDMGRIPPGKRRIGMVFQGYALYPHWTSRGNILSYFLFQKQTPELHAVAEEKLRRTSELLGVDIEYLLDRKPATLSGGEQQRVALGRCITRDPALFLLDEPFANLDQQLREKYRASLRRLLKGFKITTVYVTHDQQEAMVMADLITIMSRGRIEQVGTYEEIYERPRNTFVAEFLNLHVGMQAINVVEGGLIAAEFSRALIGIRPEGFVVCEEERVPCLSGVIGHVVHMPIKGSTSLYVHVQGQEIHAQVPLDESLQTGRDIHLRPKSFHVFDRHSGLRLATQAVDGRRMD